MVKVIIKYKKHEYRDKQVPQVCNSNSKGVMDTCRCLAAPLLQLYVNTQGKGGRVPGVLNWLDHQSQPVEYGVMNEGTTECTFGQNHGKPLKGGLYADKR